ncbi:unnamed protein product [Amoebophrya sp. A25]|nr:unnamed protein product [Amoebophrya sp. A25]|eukprot:GSA25T00023497001.1
MDGIIQGLKGIKSIQDVVDVVKDVATEVAYDQTPLEKNLSEATSNANWNVSNTLKYSIAESTRSHHDFRVIMRHIWDCISPAKGRKWRQVFKALTLLEFLIKNGSDRCIDEVRDNQFKIRSLSSFSHIEDGKDRGQGVRDLSGIIVQLVSDASLLQEERQKAKEARQRTRGIATSTISSGGGGGKYSGFGSDGYKDRDSGGYSTKTPTRESGSKPEGEDFDPNRKISAEKSGGDGKVGIKSNRIASSRTNSTRPANNARGAQPSSKKESNLLDDDFFPSGGAAANSNSGFGDFSGGFGDFAAPPSSGKLEDDFFGGSGGGASSSGGFMSAPQTTSTTAGGSFDAGFGDFSSGGGFTNSADTGFGDFASSSGGAASILSLNAPAAAPASGSSGAGGDGLLDLLSGSNPGKVPSPGAGVTPTATASKTSNPLLDLVDFDMPSTTPAAAAPTPAPVKADSPKNASKTTAAPGNLSALSAGPPGNMMGGAGMPGGGMQMGAGGMQMGGGGMQMGGMNMMGGAGGIHMMGGGMNNMGPMGGMGMNNMGGGMQPMGGGMMGNGMGNGMGGNPMMAGGGNPMMGSMGANPMMGNMGGGNMGMGNMGMMGNNMGMGNGMGSGNMMQQNAANGNPFGF